MPASSRHRGEENRLVFFRQRYRASIIENRCHDPDKMDPMRQYLLLCSITLFLFEGRALAQSGESRISAPLQRILESTSPEETELVWVTFRDKGDAERRLGEARDILSPRALDRRARRGLTQSLVAVEDVPPLPEYVRAVRRRVTRFRHVSRWFNAVSAEADESQIAAIAALPFVRRIDIVRRYRRGKPELSVSTGDSRSKAFTGRKQKGLQIDYGSSFGQLEQIQVPAVHDLGFHGEGVVIAIFDTGFRNLDHDALTHLDVAARWDFVNGDRTVSNNRDRGDGSHGTAVASVLGGFAEEELVGPAFAATFLLAKTEDTESETPLEEDNWAAAAEWAEALGADVISSSLGYLEFDAPHASYTYEDMDGRTAITTRAAQMAAQRGVVVVTSAGNEGFNGNHNTLGAPADGRLVLAVGAVDAFDNRVDFSSVGPTADGRIKPDVMAQGVLVKTASPRFPDQYRLSDGTSFACPLTAGVAALVLQAHPDWTVRDVRSVLRSTASNADTPNRTMGWGILDALAAVRARRPSAQQ